MKWKFEKLFLPSLAVMCFVSPSAAEDAVEVTSGVASGVAVVLGDSGEGATSTERPASATDDDASQRDEMKADLVRVLEEPSR